MKRFFLAVGLMLCVLVTAGHASTTVSLWSDGYTIWSKTVTNGYWTNHHTANAKNTLKKNGVNFLSGQSGFVSGNASYTIAAPFIEANYSAFGSEEIYCQLVQGIVFTSQGNQPTLKAGSSLICLYKYSNLLRPDFFCSAGWETGSYKAIWGCNAKCASEVLMTIYGCYPLSYTYLITKRWVEGPTGFTCFGQNFNPTPSACTGGNCMQINYP